MPEQRNLLIVHSGADLDELWATARAVAEFGTLHIALTGIERQDQFSLPRNLFGAQVHFMPTHLLTDCTRLLLEGDVLPRVDLVIIGCTATAGAASVQDQNAAAALVYKHGISVLSATLSQQTDGRSHLVTIQYAIERLTRNVMLPAPKVLLEIEAQIPKVHQNILSGFCEFTNPNSLPHPVLVGPLMTDHKALELLWQRVYEIGSRQAYEQANKARRPSVYHFKGAILTDPGLQRSTPPAGGGIVIESYEQSMLRYATGRVLDIGCGNGRIALYLMQTQAPPVGEVVGIDGTPLALQNYEARFEAAGISPVITHLGDVLLEDWQHLGQFDTLLLCGNNFGIAPDFEQTVFFLQKLRRLAHDGSRLIGSSRHSFHPRTPVAERQVSLRNLDRGFGAGERWLRFTYEAHDSGWVQWYYLSPDELSEAASQSGWKLNAIFYTTEHDKVIESLAFDQFEAEAETDEYGALLTAI